MIYTFEILKGEGKVDIAYIYANTTVEACKLFDDKHVGFFDGVNVFVMEVLVSYKKTTHKKCWSC